MITWVFLEINFQIQGNLIIARKFKIRKNYLIITIFHNRNYFELVFTRWSGTDSKGNTCKTTSQINNALNDAALAIAVVNSYFDFDDYNSPIKTYLDDQFYYYFLPGYEKETDVYIQQNSAEQLDSYFRYSPDGSQSNFIGMYYLKSFKNYKSLSKKF